MIQRQNLPHQIYQIFLRLESSIYIFQTERKTFRVAQCDQSRAFIKVTETIFEIESLEQKCVIIKGLLQPEQQKQHMYTIGEEKLLSNIDVY